MSTAEVIAKLAVLLCIVVPARCASRFFPTEPRLFAAFSLLSLSFAILWPYYASTKAPPDVAAKSEKSDIDPKKTQGNTGLKLESQPASTELLPAFNGFLQAFVGVLFSWEAAARRAEHHRYEVRGHDRLLLFFLIAIVLPGSLDLLGLKIEQKYLEGGVSTILNLLGFYYLFYGVHKFASTAAVPLRPAWLWLLGGLFLVYSAVEIVFTVSLKLNEYFLVLFAALKVSVTLLITFIVLWTDSPEEERNRGVIDKTLDVFSKLLTGS
jgi:hypothetical protein